MTTPLLFFEPTDASNASRNKVAAEIDALDTTRQRLGSSSLLGPPSKIRTDERADYDYPEPARRQECRGGCGGFRIGERRESGYHVDRVARGQRGLWRVAKHLPRGLISTLAGVAELIVRRFETPDERREFALGYYELLTVGALTMGREYLEPGWKWSTHVKPIVGTEWCEVRHVGFQVSGQWVCAARNGTEVVIGPGDAFDVAAGHDAWVLGDEPSVTIDFQGSDYAAAPESSKRILATMVFTDIVGSTAMAERLGDAGWKRILRTHLEDINVLLTAYRGTLVDVAGDGVFARFGSPADALRCARAVVQATGRQEIEVRVGVHTAEVEFIDNDVRGIGVHLAARIMAAASGSEILVSATTRDLASGTELTFTEKGTFDLKGISGPRTLYALDDGCSLLDGPARVR